MACPYMDGELEEVIPRLGISGQKLRQRRRTLECVAASARSHYVAVRPVTAFNTRLNVVDGQRRGLEHLPAVNAAMTVSLKNICSLHPASTP